MSLLASTRAYLAAHAPDDPGELTHLAAMRSLVDGGDPVFTRSHVTPGHFTASAFVASPEGDALLLVHHPKLLRWLQPGGHVEPGDLDLLAAARREAAEETGLTELPQVGTGIFDVDVHLIPARASEPAHLHFDVRFLFRAPRRAVRLEDGISGAAWVPLTALAIDASDASVRRAAEKLLRRSAL